LEAFTAAGAESVTNFQTNGTVIFSANDPTAVVEQVRPQLLAATGYADAVVVMELDERHAVTGWAAAGTAHGSNPTLTRMLGVPVTCRGIPTMIRLATRL
jgi:hypothetical protein